MFSVVNGQPVTEIPLGDRGFQYGDGLFETVRYLDHSPLLYDYHINRFKAGAQALAIPFPEGFTDSLNKALEDWKTERDSRDFIVKWMLTRGVAGRGYRPPDSVSSNLVFIFSETPDYPLANYSEGISLKICKHPLSRNAKLAGIKHCNRLDQVLASNELGVFEEGVMTNGVGHVIEGTKSNLIFFNGNRIATPRIDDCGVDGCLRQFLLETKLLEQNGLTIEEKIITVDDLATFEGAAVINSVFGLWPVKSIEKISYLNNQSLNTLVNIIHKEIGKFRR